MIGRIVTGGLLLLVGSAAAGRAQDPDAGHRLAEKWCVNCHVVAPGQERGTSTGAPSFRDIAAQKSMTPMALRVFLQTPHDRMPDLHLSHEEIGDLSAYIVSMRDPGKS
jgi:mono/diheme cytochrome c family protein